MPPVALTRADIGRLATKDKWYLELQTKLQQALAIPVPSPKQVSSLWQTAVKAYAAWIKASHEAEWKAQTVRTIRGQMGRRLVELRENETSRRIHAIKLKLGAGFLHRAKERALTVLRKPKSLSRSAKPTETQKLPPEPSTVPSTMSAGG